MICTYIIVYPSTFFVGWQWLTVIWSTKIMIWQSSKLFVALPWSHDIPIFFSGKWWKNGSVSRINWCPFYTTVKGWSKARGRWYESNGSYCNYCSSCICPKRLSTTLANSTVTATTCNYSVTTLTHPTTTYNYCNYLKLSVTICNYCDTTVSFDFFRCDCIAASPTVVLSFLGGSGAAERPLHLAGAQRAMAKAVKWGCGGFHGHEGTPIPGWFLGKSYENDWKWMI